MYISNIHGIMGSISYPIMGHLEGLPHLPSTADAVTPDEKNTEILQRAELFRHISDVFGEKVTEILQKSPDVMLELQELTDFPLSQNVENQSWAIGPYRVLQKLGDGGYGVVLEAFDEQQQRFVALKLAMSPHAVDILRFLNGATILETLSHPNIVTVLDKGKVMLPHIERECPFIVIPLYPSKPVDELEDGLLTPHDVLTFSEEVLLPILEAICYAHEQGVVHRDVKPDNVMVDGEGVPKLIDFNFATRGTDELNENGEILGTPMYMAPEQALQPKQINEKSDLYSFAVTAITLITGDEPFPPSMKPLEIVDRLEKMKTRGIVEDKVLGGWKSALLAAGVPRHLRRWLLDFATPHVNLREIRGEALERFKTALEKDWKELYAPKPAGCMAWLYWAWEWFLEH